MRLQTVKRARYLAQHHGLAISLGTISGVIHKIMNPGMAMPPREAIVELRRRFDDILARDFDNVRAGVYPERLLFDLPVMDRLRSLPLAAFDTPRVLRRVRRKKTEDLPAGVDRGAYPAYYLRNFHWQTDGWLSDRSARLYDLGVDILFGGSSDIMRRMALPPIVEGVRGVDRPRILDIACGTGRYLKQLHVTLPQARLVGVDLSPYYLARARGELPRAADVTLARENAEELPYADGTFDAVVSVFLFHELPRDARRRVMREARRVLKPGGRIAVLDSAQAEDVDGMAWYFEKFGELYHEPYLKGYLRDDLGDMMTECGFRVIERSPAFLSKLVVAE
jgi:ubiquinone/menaquinone biosynthesis C-methylase UbiE